MKYKPETQTVYYYKPGQTSKNSRISERSLALVVPGHVYERFTDYGQENYKVALLAEREAKKLAALKQAGQDMREAQGIKNHSIKEQMENSKKDDTIEFMEEVKAQKAKEHAKIVQRAREMILQNIPQCRALNRALKVSECVKELEEQIKFQKKIKDMYKNIDNENIKAMNEDVEKYHEEERLKKEAQIKKTLNRRAELEEMINENRKRNEALQQSIKQEEIEQIENHKKEMEELKLKELEEAAQKREELKKMCLESIELKKKYEERAAREEKFGMAAVKEYCEEKNYMEKTMKEKIKQNRQEKIDALEKIVQRFSAKMKKKNPNKLSHEEMIDEICKKVEAKREQEELEKIAQKQQKKEKIRKEILEQQKQLKESEVIRKKNEMEFKTWEFQQRVKRDEFNKIWEQKHGSNNIEKKKAYGKLLKFQMADKLAEKKKMEEEEKKIDNIHNKEMIEKCNARILAYAEKVFEESKGVRPLYPIIKAIRKTRKDIGVDKPDKEKNYDTPMKVTHKRGKKMACTKPIKEEDKFYFA